MPAPSRLPTTPIALLEQEVWHLDPWHTQAHFRVVHRGAGWVRGRFTRIRGTVDMTDGLDCPQVDITIDTVSLSTGVPLRDRNVLAADYLDAERFPHLRFTARRLERTGALTGRLHGSLSLHGRTRPTALNVLWRGGAPDSKPDHHHAALTAHTEISLAEFGIHPAALPGLALLTVGDRVRVDLDVVLLDYDPADLLPHVPVA